MFKSRIVGGLAGLVVVLAGCSSAEEGGTKSDEVKPAPRADAGGGAGSSGSSGGAAVTDTTSTEPVDCVRVGAKGNTKGVGAFCKGSSDCTQGTFCTAGVAPKGAEFCTAFCSSDADCGEGASCFRESRGSACVPAACLELLK
jgi:hypothetical protein